MDICKYAKNIIMYIHFNEQGLGAERKKLSTENISLWKYFYEECTLNNLLCMNICLGNRP